MPKSSMHGWKQGQRNAHKMRSKPGSVQGFGAKMRGPYRKSEAIRELEKLAMEAARMKYPTIPHLAPRTFRDDTANTLTGCIVAYLRLKGGFVSRLNNTGIYDKKLKRYRPGTSRKGLPDVLATYKGKSLFIEVKAGKDKISINQAQVMKEQITSGGMYFIASDFSGVKEWIDGIK